jgi:choline dehydrogenase-like flavoprotein
MAEAAACEQQMWDVLIVGTGMAGATLGYALAKGGKKVLFCERGRSHLNNSSALRGNFAETFFPYPDVPRTRHREVLMRAGRSWQEIEDVSQARSRSYIPFVGSGAGGSSALYGMALERFFPADFTPRHNYPEATGAALPENWPISYAEFIPYYQAAEKLFRVRGAVDPCRGEGAVSQLQPAPPLQPPNQELYDFLHKKGLHPYQFPKACENVPGCLGCQGFLCPRECKNDSARICLVPALEQHEAALLDECEVLRLEATRTAVTGVLCRCHGQELTLRAQVVVLAAGALETPRLLFQSACAAWPKGLANDSGLVGRNLMRHYVDLYAIALQCGADGSGDVKELAFNDLYQIDGQKFGTVQSFGLLPPASILVAGMEQEVRDGRLPWITPFFKLAKPVLRTFLRRLLSGRLILASIMEDLPYEDNRIFLRDTSNRLGASQLLLQYRISEFDRARIRDLRARLRDILSPYRFQLIKQAENNERLAHACGTCRFGLDPKKSVLNSANQAHGLSNLYVVDSSFFPSAGGTNPGLTIAANALRVAGHLLGRTPQQLITAHAND